MQRIVEDRKDEILVLMSRSRWVMNNPGKHFVWPWSVAAKGFNSVRFSSVLKILVAFSIIATPIALGGVHSVVALSVAATGLCAWAVQLFGATGDAQETLPTRISIPTLGLWLFALVCLVHVIPVPEFLHRLLNPTGLAHFHDGWQVAFPAQEVDRTWRALSLDPRGSADHGLRWLGLGIFAIVAANIGFKRRHWRALLWVVLASGTVVLAIGLAQKATDTGLFLGFYEATIGVRTLSTFVNSNHAAVFFGIVSLSGFALAMQEYRSRPMQAILASLAGMLFLVVMAMHHSDGTLLAYGLGLLMIGAGLSLRMGLASRIMARVRALSRAQVGLLLTAWLCAMVLFVALMGPGWFGERLQDSAFGEWLHGKGWIRYMMIRAALVGSLDYLALGSGAGSLERVLPPYFDWSQIRSVTIPTVENEPVEWLLTMGLLPTVIAGGLFLSGLWWSGRKLSVYEHRSRYLVVFGLALFIFVIAHFHFPFYTLGITVPWIIVFEYGLSRRAGGEGSGKTREGKDGWQAHLEIGPRAARGMWGGSCAAFVLFAVLCFGPYNVAMEEAIPAAGPQPGAAARLVRLTPTESQVYTRLAVAARGAGELNQAARLAEHAFELRPTSRQLLFAARARAANQDQERAVSMYQTLFGPAYTDAKGQWIEQFMIRDLPGFEDRVEALALAPPPLWIRAAREISAREGTNAAVDFALALMDRHPTVVEAHLAVIEVYRASHEPLLAEIWARLLIAKGLEPSAPDRLATGHAQLVDILVRQGRREEAWTVLVDAARVDVRDPEVGYWILRLRPALPADDEQVRLISFGRTLYCGASIEERRLQLCWEAEAWLHEHHGRLEDARIVLRRVAMRWLDPRGLAQFFVRQGMCFELEGWSRELNADSTRKWRHLDSLSPLSRACSGAREQ